MSKSIWIFNHYAGPPSIASGTRHYNFGKYLQEAGYQVTIFAASAIHNTDKNLITDHRAYIEDNAEGVPFVFLKTRQYKGNGKVRLLNMLDYYRGLFRVTKQFEKPDVILASSVHPLACVAGIKIAKKLGVPCICEIRDLWPESIVEYQGVSRRNPLIWALYKLEKWIYMKADRLIFTMEGGKAYIAEQPWAKGFDFTKVFHINNGVDLDAFKNNMQVCVHVDDDLANPDIFKLVYTGSLRTANDCMKLVEAAAALQECKADHIRLLIWGEGDARKTMQAAIEAQGLRNILMKGHVGKAFVPSILAQADATIVQFKQVGLLRFGVSFNKLFEYFAVGKPILSTVDTGYDLIKKYHAGVHAQGKTAADIADAMIMLENCQKEQYNLYCDGAKKAAADHDFKLLTQKLIAVIESM